MRKPTSFIMLLFFIIVVLSVVQIVVSNRLSTTGIALGKLQDEIKIYKTENSQLSEKILVLTSFAHLADSAEKAGFVKVKSRIVLSNPPLAIKR